MVGRGNASELLRKPGVGLVKYFTITMVILKEFPKIKRVFLVM